MQGPPLGQRGPIGLNLLPKQCPRGGRKDEKNASPAQGSKIEKTKIPKLHLTYINLEREVRAQDSWIPPARVEYSQ